MAGDMKDRELRAAIKRATPPAMIGTDSRGLYLQVSKAGTTSWLFRFQLHGKRRDMGLGNYPDTSLAKARTLAGAARDKLREGRDPIEERRTATEEQRAAKKASEARAVTFDDAAADYIKAHRASWKNTKHAQQWKNTLKAYASPVIGKTPVADVSTADVLEILKPIWTAKTETATRVRSRIELVLDAAKARGLRTGDNPARLRGHLANLLPKAASLRQVEHHPALPWRDLPEFWEKLRASTHYGAAPLALVILTACRAGSVFAAEWSEFDLEERTWTIPGVRMKGRRGTERPHRVPLSDAAVAILEELKASAPAREEGAPPDPRERFVFPGRSRAGHISTAAMDKCLEKLERDDVTVHGFRSTFRDWAAEVTHYPRDVAEMALAHTVASSVEAAYRRGDLLEKRRALMKDWAAFVTTKPAKNVVQLDAHRQAETG